jgi:hypothetical protein
MIARTIFQVISAIIPSSKVILRVGCTYDLQLFLPKLLLLRLIQKRKLSDMMHKDIPQDRQLRVQRTYFAKVGFERRAEALECGGGVELCDLVLDLLGYQLALQVCCLVSMDPQEVADGEIQCSCFPVSACPCVSPPRGFPVTAVPFCCAILFAGSLLCVLRCLEEGEDLLLE